MKTEKEVLGVMKKDLFQANQKSVELYEALKECERIRSNMASGCYSYAQGLALIRKVTSRNLK